MRIRYAMLALLLVGSAAYAETDYIALQKIEAIKKGANTPDQIQDLRVQDDATIGDDLAVGGDATVAGAATVTGAATVLGKGVVVDSSANVQYVQTTNVTMHTGTVWTNTFPTVFGATPTTVIITPTELHAAVPFYTAATPSNILVTVEADKNFTLTCIGKK